MPRYDEFGDTIPTDHAPLEGEPRKPLYPPRRVSDHNDSQPSARLLAAVLLVALCAVIVMVAVPVRG